MLGDRPEKSARGVTGRYELRSLTDNEIGRWIEMLPKNLGATSAHNFGVPYVFS